jgi:hypothetical protein
MKIEIKENATRTNTNYKLHDITCNKSSEADSFENKKKKKKKNLTLEDGHIGRNM